jgi:hypothetical protein
VAQVAPRAPAEGQVLVPPAPREQPPANPGLTGSGGGLY